MHSFQPQPVARSDMKPQSRISGGNASKAHGQIYPAGLAASRSWIRGVLPVLLTGAMIGLAADPVSITRQPTNSLVLEGATAAFSVTVEPLAGAAFQWRRDGTNVPGATTAGLSVSNVHLDDVRAYDVVVSGGGLSLTSTVVTINLLHPADTSPADGLISEAELTAYANSWRTGGVWSVAPTSIPDTYVSRAAFLFKQGGAYRTATALGAAPLHWEPDAGRAVSIPVSANFSPAILIPGSPTAESSTILISGQTGPTRISVNQGAVILVNGAVVGSSATVRNGDLVRLRFEGVLPPGGGELLVQATLGNLTRDWRILGRAPKGLNDLPPAPTGSTSGAIAGKFNVSEMGAATYSIPVTVSPGVAGLTPQLAINYSSQGSDGMLGVGWSLGGLSAISRAPKTIEIDGVKGSVTLTDTDRFTLDGQPLILINGENGKDGAEYRTRRESFQQVISRGREGEGPGTFEVYTKSGLKMEYGASANGRVLGNLDPEGTVMVWLLEKVSDTVGNSYTISYVEPVVASAHTPNAPAQRPTGVKYPTEISYVGGKAKVKFEYEEVDRSGPDATVRYVAGSYSWNTRRLKEIVSTFDDKRVRSYTLNYDRRGLLGRAFLASVVEKGFTERDQHPATTFTYAADLNPLPAETVPGEGIDGARLRFYTVNEGLPPIKVDDGLEINRQQLDQSAEGHGGGRGIDQARLRFGDFNGDGRTDIYHIRGNDDKPVADWVYISKTNGTFETWKGGPQTTINVDGQYPSRHLSRVQFGDFNGDGMTDVYVFMDEGASADTKAPDRIYLSNGKNGFHPSFKSSIKGYSLGKDEWFEADISRFKFADFNGDGLTDVYQVRGDAGDARQQGYLWINQGGSNAENEWRFSKHEGIFTTVGSGNLQAALSKPAVAGVNLNSIVSPETLLQAASRFRIGDFNGDGKADILVIRGRSKDTAVASMLFTLKDDFECQPTDGAPFADNQSDTFSASEGPAFTIPPDKDDAAVALGCIQLGDFNGDGKMDIYHIRGVGENKPHVIFFGRGDGSFSAPVETGRTVGVDGRSRIGKIDVGRYKFADFNGDGKTDFLYLKGTGELVNSAIFLSIGDGKFSSAFKAPRAWVRSDDEEEGPTDVASTLIADFNGDGRADFARFNYGFQLTIRHQILEQPELLTSVTDGHGITTRVQYSTLTESGVVEKDAAGTTDLAAGNFGFSPPAPDFYQINPKGGVPLEYPLMYFRAPLFLVRRVEAPNGIGGTNATSYRYRNGMLHLLGGGFQGFEEFIVLDETTGNQSSTVFSHEALALTHLSEQSRYRELKGFLPFAGMAVRATQSLVPEIATQSDQRVVVNEAFSTPGYWRIGKRFFSFIATNLNRTFEHTDYADLNSKPAPAKTTVTTTTYGVIEPVTRRPDRDAESGNVTQMTIDEYDGDAAGQPRFRTTTVNTYQDNLEQWHLGRLTTTQVTKSKVKDGGPASVRKSSFAYHPLTGLLNRETVEPGNPALELNKDYEHDASGNIVVSRQYINNAPPRTLTTTYDADRRFVLTTQNAAGHSESYTYDPLLGLKLSQTGPNGLTTSWEYDGFGRALAERRPDGTVSRTTYRRLPSNVTDAPAANNGNAALIFVQTDGSDGGTARVFYDLLGREVRRTQDSFAGDRRIVVDSFYNSRGELVRKTEPFFLGDTPLFTTMAYDRAGRGVTNIAPGNRVTVTEYFHRRAPYAEDEPGLAKTIVTNPKGQKRTLTKDIHGKVIRSRDDAGKEVRYTYDPYDNPIAIEDSKANASLLVYNIRGFKTHHKDPDAGESRYEYNAFGELTSQVDARFSRVELQYDVLGRLVRRIEPEGETRWTYDTATKGIGKLAAVEFQPAKLTATSRPYLASYRYNALGLLVETREVIQVEIGGEVRSEVYVNGVVYDELSRAAWAVYPSGLVVENRFNQRGFLATVVDGVNGAPYWTAGEINARGQLVRAFYGSRIHTLNTFDANTALPVTIQASRVGDNIDAANLQNLFFEFDVIGNLNRREDRLGGTVLREDFTFDNLNRLLTWQANGQPQQSAQYDELGNITFKTGVGAYTYNPMERPHAVTGVSELGLTYSYDSGGNRTKSLKAGKVVQELEYASYNKPTLIIGNESRLEFSHGPSRDRYLQRVLDARTGNLVSAKVYGGGGYEREYRPGEVKETHYIQAAGGAVAVRTLKHTLTNGTDITSYLLRDHLGSLQTIVAADASSLERLSYDPWGLRRNADTWAAATTATGIRPAVDRGFTGHEHLEEVDLIHMNGRVYDPVIGRFLTADPFVQDSSDLQCLNRYSYVLNNPLSFTDPSGHFAFIPFIVAAVAKAAAAVVAVAPQIAVTSSIAFTVSFAGTLAQGGSFGDALVAGLKAGAISALTSGFAAGVGGIFGATGTVANEVARAAAHGVTQGAVRKLSGGTFLHGFQSGAIGSLVGHGMEGVGVGAGTSQWLASAIIAGTFEKMSGGTFVNGAGTASAVYAFNQGQNGPLFKLSAEKNYYELGWSLSGHVSESIGRQAAASMSAATVSGLTKGLNGIQNAVNAIGAAGWVASLAPIPWVKGTGLAVGATAGIVSAGLSWGRVAIGETKPNDPGVVWDTIGVVAGPFTSLKGPAGAIAEGWSLLSGAAGNVATADYYFNNGQMKKDYEKDHWYEGK